MIFRCLSTGSGANCYLLIDKAGNILIIDAGCTKETIFANLPEKSNVCGCVITHSHDDHSHSADALEIYMPVHRAWTIHTEDDVIFEDEYFKVRKFPVDHNHPNWCFAILCKTEQKRVLFATDFFHIDSDIVKLFSRTPFDLLAVECNYCEIIYNMEEDSSKKFGSLAHFSDNQFMTLMAKIVTSPAQQIVAIHGSNRFFKELILHNKFRRKFANQLHIAEVGLKVQI